MSGSTPDYNEIILDGWHFKLNGSLHPSAVDRFPGKVTIGDYSLDSNDLLSALVISDLTGGHGVSDLKEGVDDTRYRFGDIYTRYPGQFTKPFKVTSGATATGGTFRPIGEMYDDALELWDFYSRSGNDLYRNLVDTGNNLAGETQGRAVAFRGAGATTYLYIPLGPNGYAIYEPATPTFANINAGGDADNFRAFTLWDDKLIGITTGGQLYYAIAAANPTTFTSYGAGGKLDDSVDPIALHVYYNRSGEPAIHLVTDSGVWVFDPATPRLYEIPDFTTPHPFFGFASCVWRGSLYVASGMDILEYNGNVVRNIGLSRDDGLPYLYAKYVRSMDAGLNGIYALVTGQTSGGSTRLSVHEYSGLGWHCVFAAAAANTPSRAMITRAQNDYRIYWGTGGGGSYYYQSLPSSFTNPREAIDAGGFDFGYSGQTTYYLETGKFDANMKGYRKIANAIECDVRTLPTNATVVIKYRIDNATSWTTLGTIAATGTSVLQFGTLTSDNIYPGLGFESIELRMEFQDPVATTGTPVVESLVFSFLKVMNPSWSWTAQIDLTSQHEAQSPENMLAKLIELKDSTQFFTMKHRDDTYRVRLSQLGGADETGLDTRGMYTLSIIEIPARLGTPE